MLRCPAVFTPDHYCGSKTRLHLRTIKIGVVKLRFQCRARNSLRRVIARCEAKGIKVVVTSGDLSGFRSCQTQRETCERICGDPNGCPGLCAPPGDSAHQIGAAADIRPEHYHDSGRFSRIMEEEGWCHPALPNDPNHWSYGVCR